MQQQVIPQITVSLGDSIASAQKASGLDFNLRNMTDLSPHIVAEPVTVRYAGSPGAIDLPPARSVWIDQAGGRVYQVVVTPQLEALPLERANALAERLITQLAASGWTALTTYPTDLTAIQVKLADPARKRAYEKQYGEWRAGSAFLRVALKEMGWTLHPRPASPRFLVEFEFRDPSLSSGLKKAVYERRQRVNGSMDSPLPVSVWLDQP